MIPTSIDGTDITGATIDGTDVQEITVDGQTVFTSTQPATLHPSAIYRWPLDEGSGSIAANSITNDDFSLNTSTAWQSGNYQGGFALGLFGSALGFANNIDIASRQDVLICGTIQTSTINSSNEGWIGWEETQGFSLIEVGSTSVPFLRLTDGSNNPGVFGNTDITDNDTYRVAAGIEQNNRGFIAVNGNIENSVSFGTFGPGLTDNVTLGNRGGETDTGWEGIVDDVIIYDDTSQTVIDDDFNIQPWS